MKGNAFCPIGVFDSGLGGLTVLRELIKALPHEEIIYLGDTARVPYGNKSPSTVTRYAFENTGFLLKKSVKLLILACNTASAYSIDAIKTTFSIPSLGVIQPGARAAVQKTRSGKVGVIGTIGTIQSNAYRNAIKSINPGIVVYEKACPLFVPLVEEGWIDNDITEMVAKRYLDVFEGKGIDVLILGCTHYPLLKGIISKVMGPDVELVDSAQETANEAKIMLENLDILKNQDSRGGYNLYVTDVTKQFSTIASIFLGEVDVPVEQVTLDEIV